MATHNLMMLAHVAENELHHDRILPYVQEYMKIWAEYMQKENVKITINDIYTNTSFAWNNVKSTFDHSSKTINQTRLSQLFFTHANAFKTLYSMQVG